VRRLVSTFVALLPIAAAVAACDYPCCRSDVDCDDGVACFEGLCVSRCVLDADCLDGASCVEGRCSPNVDVGNARCAGAPVPVGAQAEAP
jgi:hypothetical protein